MQRKTRIKFNQRKRQIMIVAAILMMALIIVMPAAAQTTLDFTATPPSPYGGAQDACGTGAVIEDVGATLHLTGNCWQKVAFAYTITPNTILEFDFQSNAESDIHGIGFDTDDTINNPIQVFQLAGTQVWGNQTSNTYAIGSGIVHYTIPVGTFYTGSFTSLTFTNDHDVAIPDGESIFSNIQVYEGTPPPPPMLTVNGSDYLVESYGGGQDSASTVSIEDAGLTMRIVGNGWKKVAIPYTITPDTVLEVDFSSSAEGEIHGIGFDVDDTIDNPNRFFQLSGTQTWSDQTYNTYVTGSGTLHYSIPVGTFYTGSFLSLTFANDHDVTGATGEGVFSNIVIHEAPVSQTITFGPLANMNLGDPDFTVSATASSGLPVSFAATGDCAVAVDLVSITGAGSCTITASQAGDYSYLPAADVAQTFTIYPASLYAVTGTTTMPDLATIPVWGYNNTNAPVTQPGGPTLIVNEGDTVEIVLHNQLTEQTALAVNGQTMVPDLTGVAPGGSKLYTFTASQPGTYLYEAGQLPNGQHQVAMGLYGVLIVRPATAGQAYNDPASAYDDEAVLLLSEIDPALNNTLDPATFDMREYKPRYWLINGKAFPNTQPILTVAGNKVLLRYANAGLQDHTMALLGLDQLLLANDGFPYNYNRSAVSENMGAGETMDMLVDIPATMPDGSKIPLYDSSLILHNNNAAGFGGLVTFITTADGPAGPDTIGPTTSAVALSQSPTDGTVDVSLTASVSDVATGNANIAAAEFYIDDTNGTAMPLYAADTAFDSPVEAVDTTIFAATVAAMTPGDHTIYVRGQDALGNWGSFNIVTLRLELLDSGPQTRALTLVPNPNAGDIGVALSGTADDSATGNSDIIGAEYFIGAAGANGSGTAMAVNLPIPIASIDAEIPASTLTTEGITTIHVHSQDAFGIWGPMTTIDFEVDRTGPVASNVVIAPNPNNGNLPINPSLFAARLDATLTDGINAGVQSNLYVAEFFINAIGADGTGIPMYARDGLFDTPNEEAYALISMVNINALANGSHTIYVHGRDDSGNWGSFTTETLVIERDVPTVTGTAATPNPTNGASAVDLTAVATDAGSVINQAEWFVDADPGTGNGTAMSITPNAGNYDLAATIDITGWADGDYTLSVRARDAAGTWSLTDSTILTVAGAPPAVPTEFIFSTIGNGVVPGTGTPYDDADVYHYDITNDTYSRLIDGSAIGLPGNADIDGLVFDAATGLYYVTFARNGGTNIPLVGVVQDEDIVEYDPENGEAQFFFEGADACGLADSNGQDMDALDIVNGVIYFSTAGNSPVDGVAGPNDDADIYMFDGNCSRVFDGSVDGSLPGNADIDGLAWIDADTFYVSFRATTTTVPGLGTIQDEDIVQYDNGVWTLFFDGTAEGLNATNSQDLDAIDIP